METTTETMTAAQRRAHNQAVHREQRMAKAAARGPAGIAFAWADEARAVAREWERNRAGTDDADAAWNDLATTLANFVKRYGR
ncbi:hypothetical protein ACIPYQ_39670 [Streptomyces sp. NPDC090045]|uniref:hypothetical protein n=1 Tax=Streptomyces sp. NPDC090045 TaxID=3365927 RepID=UPI0038144134